MLDHDDDSIDDAAFPPEQDNPLDDDYHSEASVVSVADPEPIVVDVESDEEEQHDSTSPFFRQGSPDKRQEFKVRVPTFEELGASRDDYELVPLGALVKVLGEDIRKGGDVYYEVEFDGGITRVLSFDAVTELENGSRALSQYFAPLNPRLEESRVIELSDDEDKPKEEKKAKEEEAKEEEAPARATRASSSVVSDKRELRKRNFTLLSQKRRYEVGTQDASEEEEETRPPRRTTRVSTRSSNNFKPQMLSYDPRDPNDGIDLSDDSIVRSDLLPREKKGRRRSTRNAKNSKKRGRHDYTEESSQEEDTKNRRSGRDKKQRQSYREPGMDDDLVQSDLLPQKQSKPRILHSKEIFPLIDENEEFEDFVDAHCLTCASCQGSGNSYTRGRLVFCQGCSVTYHKECLGARNGREHLVTKVSSDNFVLQCKRCINRYRMKDRTAPAYDRCVGCGSQGRSCEPFTPLGQPKKNKDASNSTDVSRPVTPDVDVDSKRLYAANNVLFRCHACYRPWHYDHLPPRGPFRGGASNAWKKRLNEYSEDFRCADCVNYTHKIQTIVAWRPADPESRKQEDSTPLELADFTEDEREYLVKAHDQSYFQVKWVPGSWVAGAFPESRRSFGAKKPGRPLPEPRMTTEDAVDEEWLRIEICLDVQYSSVVKDDNVEVDLRRITEVTSALVKFRGLGYEDVVWEKPPEKEDAERYHDWFKAYEDFIFGKYVRMPKNMHKKAEKARDTKFELLERKTQPKYISGGTLMDYQKEGMNWLYYKWWKGQNAILADEMGLGKTIQIISFLATLNEEHGLFPFLIVVPHSTVPNWKREIKTWAPGLRVVAYYGMEAGRKIQRKYEMFHPNTTDLKCHVVVTSYSTPATPSDALILKKIPWEGLIVDEGQRLKNDQSLLYKELAKFKFRNKVLLTGTPLQNNPRELFNLLQFLDPKGINAAEMEEQYGELTNETVPELHAIIRPFFLRRTKAQVLTHLPPMAEVIVPVSMSTLQKELYKSILSKDPNLIKSILYRGSKIKQTERAKLNNLLMQLRKCVCHPFLYNEDVEEDLDDPVVLHKNLVEAGSKLGMLNIMLPKLKERGHRVLIFSQFLGMLDIIEDFLNGLGLLFHRLDGSVSSMEKQKRIDAFNAPESQYFAFLLSTRAGGVGINLATADTVIIMDPDFNPHQDIQALSRAHRIGQKNKVLVFHLMTRDTVEERIMQIGKKKLSLDHLIIDKMGAEGEDPEDIDVESILRFGAARLFDDEGEDRTIRYDEESVDKLLDRSSVEQTRTTGEDGNEGAENAFSFARVWANDKGALEDDAFGTTPEAEGNEEAAAGFWERVLRERQEQARREEAAQIQELGRGRRKRTVNYAMQDQEKDVDDRSDDTDFQAGSNESESDDDEEGADQFAVADPLMQFNMQSNGMPPSAPLPLVPSHGGSNAAMARPPIELPKKSRNGSGRVELIPLDRENEPRYDKCKACAYRHAPGHCALKQMGVEMCPFCGLAHYGRAPSCPHFTSETQMNAMLDSLRNSPEDKALVEEAKRYVRGRKGHVQREKRKQAAIKSVSKASSVSGGNGQAA